MVASIQWMIHQNRESSNQKQQGVIYSLGVDAFEENEHYSMHHKNQRHWKLDAVNRIILDTFNNHYWKF